MNISFKDLLAKASANGGGPGHDELEGERAKLAGEVNDLDQQLAARRVRLREVEGLLAGPVKAAVKAAELLGVAVPDEYRAATPKSPEGRKRAAGSYRWEPQPLPGSDRTEDLTAKEMELSRGLWAYTKGSSGSSGKNGEGVLSVSEFKDLLQAQIGKTELEPGETVTLKFQNGRTVKLTRLAAEK